MSDTHNSKVVLITGCGAGLGHAIALACARAGYITYASGKSLEELSNLEAAGCYTLELDVTNETSRIQAVKGIEAPHGTVDILINNAGYGQMGPLEEITPELIQKQFDVNVFGVLRLCQLVLPSMRTQHSGTILTVGSVGGLMTTPFMGAYHMSKYAIESLHDALRREVSNFGIRVILLEPESMKTKFGATTLASVQSRKPPSPYDAAQKRVSEITAKAYMSPRLLTPEYVAGIVVKAIGTSHPRPRYRIGLQARIMPFMFSLMGDKLTDRLWQRIITPKR